MTDKRKELYNQKSKLIKDLIGAEWGQALSGVCRDIYFTVLRSQKMYAIYERDGFDNVDPKELDALMDTRLAYLDLARFMYDAMEIVATYDQALNENDDELGWGFSVSFPIWCSDTLTMIDYLDEYKDHILRGREIPEYCYEVRDEYLTILEVEEDDEETSDSV